MKLLLVNDQGESVACFERVEHYDAQKSSSVLTLLDILETLIATAQGKGGAPGSKAWSQPRVPTAESGWGPTETAQEQLSRVVGFEDSNNER